MIRRQAKQGKEVVHPAIGLLLFLISLILLVFTAPLGFIYGFFRTALKSGIKGFGAYLLKIAISIDQLGNVIMQHLLNALWISGDGYKFGNRDETISSALGRNKKLGTLSKFGKAMDYLLDLIDPNHTLDSIDYYVEPQNGVQEETG